MPARSGTLVRTIAAVAVALVLFACRPASAAALRVHGVVLAVEAQNGQIVLRHDAFDNMPAMTMPFAVPAAELRALRPGNEIDATVDTARDPWTLSDISVVPARSVPEPPAVQAPVHPLAVGDLLPSPPLVDERGAPFRLASLRGQDVVLSFIYTRCRDPQMCPLISAKFEALQRKLGTRRLHLVEVSLDPAYDRPAVLERYGQQFGADPRHWTLATGAVDSTLHFAARFGVTAFADPKIGLIHSENTVEIGPDGRIRNMIVDNAWQPDDVLADIDASHGEAANPLQRLNLWLSKEAVALCGDRIAGFSGLSDLAIVTLIFGACGYAFFRLSRVFFAKGAG